MASVWSLTRLAMISGVTRSFLARLIAESIRSGYGDLVEVEPTHGLLDRAKPVGLVVDGEPAIDTDQREYVRKSRAHKLWNVPTQTLDFEAIASIRSPHLTGRFVREGERARMFRPAIPCWSRLATRRVITRVLPDPAPARTKRGPSM